MFRNFTNEQLLFLEQMINGFDPENIVENIHRLPIIEGYSLTANGCFYKNDNSGFLTYLMERMFNDRVKYKKMMIESQKKYEETKSIEDARLVARYKNFQMAKKIQLNSLYGALSNQWFRWFNFDNAESITTSGQITILYIANKMNQFINKILKTNGVDYVIASDTDSIYVTFEHMIEKSFGSNRQARNEQKIVDAIDQFCNDKIQPKLDEWYQELADMMNAYQQKMKMKRETIANKGIWKAKKMYILNAWDIEGVRFDHPKLKIQGIEAVRSSTPHSCRSAIKHSLEIIMNGSEEQLQEYIREFKEEFSNLSFEDVAFPRGVNGMKKYYHPTRIYGEKTPIHVRGALLFNNMLIKKDIKVIQPISDGDKIKFAYLKMPNPLHFNVISCPDELPIEFNLDKYIDRDMQFETTFLKPLKTITNVIGWFPEKRGKLEGLFE